MFYVVSLILTLFCINDVAYADSYYPHKYQHYRYCQQSHGYLEQQQIRLTQLRRGIELHYQQSIANDKVKLTQQSHMHQRKMNRLYQRLKQQKAKFRALKINYDTNCKDTHRGGHYTKGGWIYYF
jgi:hypothetical protein